MWKYLKHLACLLEGVATVLSGISVGEIENLRNELTTSNRRRTSFSSPRRTAASPTRKVSRVVSTVGIADVTGIVQCHIQNEKVMNVDFIFV